MQREFKKGDCAKIVAIDDGQAIRMCSKDMIREINKHVGETGTIEVVYENISGSGEGKIEPMTKSDYYEIRLHKQHKDKQTIRVPSIMLEPC